MSPTSNSVVWTAEQASPAVVVSISAISEPIFSLGQVSVATIGTASSSIGSVHALLQVFQCTATLCSIIGLILSQKLEAAMGTCNHYLSTLLLYVHNTPIC